MNDLSLSVYTVAFVQPYPLGLVVYSFAALIPLIVAFRYFKARKTGVTLVLKNNRLRFSVQYLYGKFNLEEAQKLLGKEYHQVSYVPPKRALLNAIFF